MALYTPCHSSTGNSYNSDHRSLQHNIHSFNIWKESSHTSWVKGIKGKMHGSAIPFNCYNILFHCDTQHLPRNSQFNFIQVCSLNNVICRFSSKSSPIVPYVNSFLVKYLVWSNKRWTANLLNLNINLSRSKPFKDTLRTQKLKSHSQQ